MATTTASRSGRDRRGVGGRTAMDRRDSCKSRRTARAPAGRRGRIRAALALATARARPLKRRRAARPGKAETAARGMAQERVGRPTLPEAAPATVLATATATAKGTATATATGTGTTTV